MRIGHPAQSILHSWRQPTSRMEDVWCLFMRVDQCFLLFEVRLMILIIVVIGSRRMTIKRKIKIDINRIFLCDCV